MIDPDERDELLGGPVRTLQIIVGAMTMGLLIFLVVALVVPIGGGAEKTDGETPIITYVLVGGAVLEVAMGLLVVVPLTVAAGRKRIREGTWKCGATSGATGAFAKLLQADDDSARLFFLYFVSTIIAAALVEGAAFMALIAYMVEGEPLALLLGVVCILGVAMHLPTRARVASWTRDQLGRIDQERMGNR